MNHFFNELLIIFAASLVVSLIFSRLRLPTIVAYMASGAMLGPHGFGLIPDPEEFSLLAEFGMVFLLFSLGLEFSLSKMLAIRRLVFGVGSSQVVACATVFGIAVYLWGCTPAASAIIAGALALSSTAIATRELNAIRQINNRHAQVSVGVLLFQDLAALVFLVLVPVLAEKEGRHLGRDLAEALAHAILLLVILMSAGRWVLPRIYAEISKTRSREIFVMATLVIGLLAAWLTHHLELSMTLGGFIIGMMLGESDFKYQVETDLRPFKDILLGLFFVTLGMSLDTRLLLEFWPRLLLFTAALVAIKVAVVSLVVNFLGESKRNALRSGITLAQAGEFGVALLALAAREGVLPREQASFIMILALLSMGASSLLIRKNEAVSEWLLPFLPFTLPERVSREPPPVMLHESDHVLIGGFGRVGRTIAYLLDLNKIPYIVIENDLSRVRAARKLGVNIIYGDCNDPDLLEGCHIDEARLAVLTFHSHELACRTLRHIKDQGWNDIPIILRCHGEGQIEELISLGASHVVPEILETRMLISGQVLNLLGLNPSVIETQIGDLRRQALAGACPN